MTLRCLVKLMKLANGGRWRVDQAAQEAIKRNLTRRGIGITRRSVLLRAQASADERELFIS